MANGRPKLLNGMNHHHVNVCRRKKIKRSPNSYFNGKKNLLLIAICDPGCQHNGICISPGKCSCPENFYGPFCENEKKLCISKPALPRNSRLSCSAEACSITCATGYKFPDGSSIANLVCKGGEWQPTRPELAVIPDCIRKLITKLLTEP